MRKKLVRIIGGVVACAAIVAVVLWLQFGKGKTEEETTAQTTALPQTETQTTLPAGEPETSGVVATTVGSSSETPDSTTKPQSQTLPTDKAGILSFYNGALDKTPGLKRTSYKRTLTQCKVGFPVGDKTNDSKVQALANMDDSAPVASDLVKLDDAMVASASSRVEGKTGIIEITLNKRDSGQSIQKGEGGYVGIVNFAETSELVKNIAKEALGLDTALKDNPVYHLTDGKYIVKINLETGAVSSVEFSCNESGEGRVSITSLSLGIAIQASYTA